MTIGKSGKRIGAFFGVVLLFVLAVAALPLGMLKGVAEQRLSARFDAPVTIASIDRLDHFSLSPRIRIAGVRIGQPAWAGAGDLARIEQIVIRLPLLPVLRGSFQPSAIDVNGLNLNLVRTADGTSNWNRRGQQGKQSPMSIAHLAITHGHFSLRDAKRHMTLNAVLRVDTNGLVLDGTGTHRDQPMRLMARGGKIEGNAAKARWPIRLSLASPLLRLEGQGTTDQPLDLNGFDAVVTASGTDIAYLDDIIEAGLPGSQDFSLRATVRRDRPDWNVKAIAGRIGRSDFAGAVLVKKRDGRTILEGNLDAGALDFADLSSDKGQAVAAAKRQANGPRVIPDTSIHFEKLGKLDGTLRVSAKRLLMGSGSLFQGFRGTLSMDRRILTLDPLTIQLTRGTLTGRVRVDHRNGDPKLSIDLRQRGTRLSDLMGNAEDIEGPIETRLVLDGTGREIRSALAHANGRIALAMQGGSMRKKLAIFASGDILDSIGAVIGGSPTARVPVNCLIANFGVRDGVLRPVALLLDTPVGRADGSGGASLATERLALSFTGRSKNPDPIQLAAKVRVDGIFSKPGLSLANADGQVAQSKGLLGKIGSLVGSLRTRGDTNRGLPIPPANCQALYRDALR